MSDEPNDLSPSLGGGPVDWPHDKPPKIKFQPPWFVKEDTEHREKIKAFEDRLRDMTLSLGRSIREPAPPTSGQAIEARMRQRGYRRDPDRPNEWTTH